MQKGKKEKVVESELYAARSFGYERFDDYRVGGLQLNGNEIAQFGSYARTARGEVLIIQPFILLISPNLHVYRFVCFDILIDYILIHAHHVQERISTYANVAIRLKRFKSELTTNKCACVRVHTLYTPAYTTNVVAERGLGYPDS